MHLGIDFGTSGVKAVVIDVDGVIQAIAQAPLTVSNPYHLWSEQEPSDWLAALEFVMQQLATSVSLRKVASIGITGQMHGAVLVDEHGEVIRPAILWNDGRSHEQCASLEQLVPASRKITGNLMMPGFTAPKILWVKQNEPENFKRINTVFLPKDYIRFALTGVKATDTSDASGTLFFDTQRRTWHEPLISACGLTPENLPVVHEGPDITGMLNNDIAQRWGMRSVPVIAGASDNAAGALGMGIAKPAQAMLSLGTSGVYFVASDTYSSNPESAVHSFCHALPDKWHLMSVMLSAASCLQWFADNVAYRPIPELLSEMESADIDIQSAPYFVPYLTGERTPHNDPLVRGGFLGISNTTKRAELTYAVLEGVSFGMAEGIQAVDLCCSGADEVHLIGGGARSRFWRQMLTDILNRPLNYSKGGDVGPALGAARLAQLAVQPNASIDDTFPTPSLIERHIPNTDRHRVYKSRRDIFSRLYSAATVLHTQPTTQK
jgi:xylulokinase